MFKTIVFLLVNGLWFFIFFVKQWYGMDIAKLHAYNGGYKIQVLVYSWPKVTRAPISLHGPIPDTKNCFNKSWGCSEDSFQGH